MNQNVEKSNIAKQIVIERAPSKYNFSPEGREKVAYISSPQEESVDEYNRVRDGFVYNGLSNGIEKNWVLDQDFNYAAKGPNETFKWSEEYSDCLGIVAVGNRQGGTDQISFMTHGAPQKMLNESSFEEWFRNLCRDFKKDVDTNSIAVQIFGGRVGIPQSAYEQFIVHLGDVQDNDFAIKIKRSLPKDDVPTDMIERARSGNQNFLRPYFEKMQNNYSRSLQLIQGILKEELQIHAEVDEPLREDGALNAYFDTSNRKLYVTRLESTSEATTDEIFRLQGTTKKNATTILDTPEE